MSTVPMKRGLPSKSVATPAGTALLRPTSLAGEPTCRRRSPLAASTKSGSSAMLPPPSVTLLLSLKMPLPFQPPSTRLVVMIGLVSTLYIWLPLEAVLPHRITLVRLGLLVPPLRASLSTAPPWLAELPLKLTLVRLGLLRPLLLPKLTIAPPLSVAELPLKLTLVRLGLLTPLLMPRLTIAPPW